MGRITFIDCKEWRIKATLRLAPAVLAPACKWLPPAVLHRTPVLWTAAAPIAAIMTVQRTGDAAARIYGGWVTKKGSEELAAGGLHIRTCHAMSGRMDLAAQRCHPLGGFRELSWSAEPTRHRSSSKGTVDFHVWMHSVDCQLAVSKMKGTPHVGQIR